MKKVIIAGSRNFIDYTFLKRSCDDFLEPHGEVEIVSGTAKGADQLGERYALEKGYCLKRFPADWDKYGKSAGYKRNEEMVKYADVLIAFWDGKSKGTGHVIKLGRSYNLTVLVYVV